MPSKIASILRTVTGPLYIPLRSVYMRATHPLLSRDEVHKYWRDPVVIDKSNVPVDYLRGRERSDFLAGIIETYVPKTASILEIGCNVGRNLNCLLGHGYRRVTGLEINSNALALMRESYPALATTAAFVNASLEEAAPQFRDGEFDAIYTMAVLMHIHPDSEWVLPHVVRATSQHLISVEDEVYTGGRCFARKYRQVFESFGMRQIAEFPCANVPGLGESYVARIFSH